MYEDVVTSILSNSESITFAVIAFMLILLLIILSLVTFRIFSNYHYITESLSKDRQEERKIFLTTSEQQLKALQSEVLKGEQISEAFNQMSIATQSTAETMHVMTEAIRQLQATTEVFQASFLTAIQKIDAISSAQQIVNQQLDIATHRDIFIILSADRVIRSVNVNVYDLFGKVDISLINRPFSWLDYQTCEHDGTYITNPHYIIDYVIQHEKPFTSILSVFNTTLSQRIWFRVYAHPYYVIVEDIPKFSGVLLTIKIIPNMRSA